MWQIIDKKYKGRNLRNLSLENIVCAADLEDFGVPECKLKMP
jgi:hypothetical protein